MSEANEFVVVKVGDKRRSIDNLGGTIHANPGEAEVNFILRVQAAYGGEWDGTSDSIGWRYTRKPSESPAQRELKSAPAAAAREICDLCREQTLNHYGRQYDGDRGYHLGYSVVGDIIAKHFAPLIATVADTAESEAKLKDSRQLLADYTQENESYRDERDHWRQRWEQLRDAVKEPGWNNASILAGLTLIAGSSDAFATEARRELWAKAVLPRLEAALAEPEQPDVT